jgi:hypothetical protein
MLEHRYGIEHSNSLHVVLTVLISGGALLVRA